MNLFHAFYAVADPSHQEEDTITFYSDDNRYSVQFDNFIGWIIFKDLHRNLEYFADNRPFVERYEVAVAFRNQKFDKLREREWTQVTTIDS